MPGPVSDSYDPEFSTGENAVDVREAVEQAVARIGGRLGSKLRDIVEVVRGNDGKRFTLSLTEKELRVIRFGLNRALESL